jgi:ElaB/YqjD/DUF883 family membrane-anchored ribosome-binding protein
MTNMSNTTRDVMKDARDTVREAGKAASAASSDVQEDLAGLRNDVARLGAQIADILATRGNAAWRKARSNVEDALAGAQGKGMEAVGAMREVGDNVVDAVDESLRRRPYTTLALAAAIGFVFGATWRR